MIIISYYKNIPVNTNNLKKDVLMNKETIRRILSLLLCYMYNKIIPYSNHTVWY